MGLNSDVGEKNCMCTGMGGNFLRLDQIQR